MIDGMKDADFVALQTLRDAAGPSITDAVWDQVEQQVTDVGMLGLTGTARAIVEGIVRKSGVSKQSCPPATGDLILNLKNRQTAIDAAMYGPINPGEPSDDYWQSLGEVFNATAEEARSTRCGNCAAFDETSQMQACIAEGVGGDDPWSVVDAGELGYCRVFQF